MDTPPRVIIAHPDVHAATALESAFRREGWLPVTAADTLQTLARIATEHPTALVLNSRLPGGGGLFTLKKMRHSIQTATIPVIALVGRFGAGPEELRAAGARECLPESADPETICAAVRRQMGQPVIPELPVEILRAPERLAAVRATGLLDSPAEACFDLLAGLASRLLGVPVSLMSLVDGERQFFKSQVGLPEPWASARQTPLSHSFCQWVVSGHENLALDDAREHPALATHRAVLDLGVVAYAGVPLEAWHGEPIGAFCAIDSRAHTWTNDDLATLGDLARLAEACMAVRRWDATPADTPDRIRPGGPIRTALTCAARLCARAGPHLSPADHAALLDLVEWLVRPLEPEVRETIAQPVATDQAA